MASGHVHVRSGSLPDGSGHRAGQTEGLGRRSTVYAGPLDREGQEISRDKPAVMDPKPRCRAPTVCALGPPAAFSPLGSRDQTEPCPVVAGPGQREGTQQAGCVLRLILRAFQVLLLSRPHVFNSSINIYLLHSRKARIYPSKPESGHWVQSVRTPLDAGFWLGSRGGRWGERRGRRSVLGSRE